MITTYKQSGQMPMGPVNPICNSGPTFMAAFDLLVGLCTGSVANLKVVTMMLTEMFHSDKDDVLNEWEYLPPVGPRPSNGFVGLKNAGATCYMNSVLQQLFMIEGIRNGILVPVLYNLFPLLPLYPKISWNVCLFSAGSWLMH